MNIANIKEEDRVFNMYRKYGKTCDRKWLLNNIKKNRVRNIDSISVGMFNVLIDELEYSFPKSWDFHIHNGVYVLLLHIPQTTVTNSKNQSHTVRDLIVEQPFRIINRGFSMFDITTTKTTYTEIEYSSRYTHSHVGTINTPLDTGYTCQGTSDIVSTRIFLNQYFNKDLLHLYLLSIKSFFKWESIEGVPYKSIGTLCITGLTKRLLSTLNFNPIEDYKINTLNYNIIWDVCKYKVVVDDVFKENLKKVVPKEDLGVEKDNYWYTTDKTSIDNYIVYNMDKIKNDFGVLPFVYIQGKKLEFKIIKTVELDKPNGLSVPTKIIENVTDRIESKLCKQNARRAYLKRKGINSNE